jgi:hypothetical protein
MNVPIMFYSTKKITQHKINHTTPKNYKAPKFYRSFINKVQNTEQIMQQQTKFISNKLYSIQYNKYTAPKKLDMDATKTNQLQNTIPHKVYNTEKII